MNNTATIIVPAMGHISIVITTIFISLSAAFSIAIFISYFLAWRFTKSRTMLSLSAFFLIYSMVIGVSALTTWFYIIDNSKIVVLPFYEIRNILLFLSLFNLFYVIWIYKDPSHITNRLTDKQKSDVLNTK